MNAPLNSPSLITVQNAPRDITKLANPPTSRATRFRLGLQLKLFEVSSDQAKAFTSATDAEQAQRLLEALMEFDAAQGQHPASTPPAGPVVSQPMQTQAIPAMAPMQPMTAPAAMVPRTPQTAADPGNKGAAPAAAVATTSTSAVLLKIHEAVEALTADIKAAKAGKALEKRLDGLEKTLETVAQQQGYLLAMLLQLSENTIGLDTASIASLAMTSDAVTLFTKEAGGTQKGK